MSTAQGLASTAISPSSSTARLVPPLIAVLGIAWNLFGVVQLLQTLESTPEALMQMGMTEAQAAAHASYPGWMTAGFAIGALGGLVGSALLLVRPRLAVPVLAASLGGYVVLYVGDITQGVFAALGASQVVILTTVVAVAAGLLAWSRRLVQRAAAS